MHLLGLIGKLKVGCLKGNEDKNERGLGLQVIPSQMEESYLKGGK